MSKPNLREIVDDTFRANPEYELKSYERLPPHQQEAIKNFAADPNFYGLLLPVGETSAKSVCQDTALLYLSLREPGPLPSYVKNKFGDHCDQAIAELVLDGVLQIEWNGGFVHGAEAFAAVYEAAQSDNAPQTRIANLSLDALKHAQALEVSDGLELSAWLYCYNRVPSSPRWEQLLPDEESVVRFLGFNGADRTARLLKERWRYSPPRREEDGWHSWARERTALLGKPSKWTYKLYLSPTVDALKETFETAVDVLTQGRAFSFKVGKDRYGLLRPDKFVAYFDAFDSLRQTADRLAEKLKGVPAQGVPFTVEITGDGLLSWGTDPPEGNQSSGWMERESWRSWVANRLASALLASKQQLSQTIEPYQFALERLRLEGVDVTTWTPEDAIWNNN